MQPGDEPPEPFSTLTERIENPQIQCGITRTTEATHAVIRANVHRSPMYSGQIQSRGPRYCPSIEDKIVRFGERDGHQIFLEPEGLDDPTVYPNGISTSLPEEVQLALARDHSGPGTGPHDPAGLRHRIRPRRSARAPPRRWKPSGCAGCSWPARSTAPPATRRRPRRAWWRGSMRPRGPASGREIMFDRAEGYLGVMIDDLVTRGVTEPYRMFTSRAEYRLTLRADNADQRLTGKGIAIGCVGAERRRQFETKMAALERGEGAGAFAVDHAERGRNARHLR